MAHIPRYWENWADESFDFLSGDWESSSVILPELRPIKGLGTFK